MAEYIVTEAEASDNDLSETESLHLSDIDFIDDEPIPDDKSPPYKRLCDSVEKIQLLPSTSTSSATEINSKRKLLDEWRDFTSSPVVRRLFPEKLPGSVTEDGMITYNVQDDVSVSIEELLDNTEELPRDLVLTPAQEKSKQERDLRSRFVYFTQSQHTNGLQGKFSELHKTMKSTKTMQKIWAVFCKCPQERRTVHNTFTSTTTTTGQTSHLALEALLARDCDRIRGCSDRKYCYYLLQYSKGQRSIAGLLRLLNSVGVEHALFGVPLFKRPLTRDFLQKLTTALSVDTDVTFLLEEDNETILKETYTFSMEELLTFCEDTEPDTVQQLIHRYTNLAKQGDTNALAWRNSTNCLNIAKNAYAMWKNNVQGEELDLSLTEYIHKKLENHERGNWVNVDKLLRYQGIEPLWFLNCFRKWLRGPIKGNTIVLQGPGNSGKSMLQDSIIKLLGGVFLSWHHDNQYWKSPVLGARFACIDDLTQKGWVNLDETERRALDGGTITVNKKFTQPTEVKFPPLMITTNCSLEDERFEFLRNRLTRFSFTKCVLDSAGAPKIKVTEADVCDWILKYKDTLDL
ncbi:E1 protein [Papillomaviridae sp. Seabass_c1851]|nr:E1 protein [Papillomaviridae sp. Seabass_c1851]